MSLPQLHTAPLLSPEEFLTLDRVAERRSEYIYGKILPMPGVSKYHARITTTLTRLLYEAAVREQCWVYGPDLRVWMPEARSYAYPDIVIVCGREQFMDAEFDTLLNPVCIMEVLSPSTEGYDRSEKFRAYRSIGSLQEYVLVAQNEPLIETFIRDGDHWSLYEASGTESSLYLRSVNIRLSLAEVYKYVDFEQMEASRQENDQKGQ